MQKENKFFFSFPNESTFGEANGTIKRAQYKINTNLFLLSSKSTFGVAKPMVSRCNIIDIRV